VLNKGILSKIDESISFFSIVLLDVEVSELIGVLVRGGDVEIVSEILLLEILLCEVLKVSLGEGDLGVNGDLLVVVGDSQVLAEVTSGTSNLDLGLEEFSEVGNDEDLIFNGLSAVDVESEVDLLDLLCFLSECHFCFSVFIL